MNTIPQEESYSLLHLPISPSRNDKMYHEDSKLQPRNKCFESKWLKNQSCPCFPAKAGTETPAFQLPPRKSGSQCSAELGLRSHSNSPLPVIHKCVGRGSLHYPQLCHLQRNCGGSTITQHTRLAASQLMPPSSGGPLIYAPPPNPRAKTEAVT
ncbi:UNVERIFIED_CONTAM: hypothetical protein K2H54_002714 [Gekko kuhli]